jgi:hypothetical protein
LLDKIYCLIHCGKFCGKLFTGIAVGGGGVLVTQYPLDQAGTASIVVQNQCGQMPDHMKTELSDLCLFAEAFHQIAANQIGFVIPILVKYSLSLQIGRITVCIGSKK